MYFAPPQKTLLTLSNFVELQVLGSVAEMTFLGCIETLVTDMRRDTYIHAHEDCA